MIIFDFYMRRPSDLRGDLVDLCGKIGPTNPSETTLRYNYFRGDLILRVDSADLSAQWGWVPLLDVVASLRRVRDAMRKNEGVAVLDFTENDDKIEFKRDGGTILINASYAPSIGVVSASVTDFAMAIDKFLVKTRGLLLKECPALEENIAFNHIVAGIDGQ